jgi:hypothetical protein
VIGTVQIGRSNKSGAEPGESDCAEPAFVVPSRPDPTACYIENKIAASHVQRQLKGGARNLSSAYRVLRDLPV